MDHNAGNPGRSNDDPFAEDFFLAPYAEELADRAETMRHDNRDAIRHFVEVLAWKAMENPELKEVVVRLLWNWEAVETTWLAEALFMDVRQVCEIAETEPVQGFNCLVCGSELRVRSRTHLFRLTKTLEAAYEGDCEGEHADLLCLACWQQLSEHADEQRRLTHLMRQALLADHRKLPYATRRTTQEWRALRSRMLRRAGYRCQLCGTDGVQLHVHHNTYANYGEERLEDLIVLCSECHADFHGLSNAS